VASLKGARSDPVASPRGAVQRHGNRRTDYSQNHDKGMLAVGEAAMLKARRPCSVPIIALTVLAVGLNWLIGSCVRHIAPWQAEIAGREQN